MTDCEFQEYPKWIKTPDNKSRIVDSAVQELEIMACFKKEKEDVVPGDAATQYTLQAEVPTIEIVSVAPQEPDKNTELPKEEVVLDKNALIARADELGLLYDKRWGAPKLQEAVAAAEASLVEGECEKEEVIKE